MRTFGPGGAIPKRQKGRSPMALRREEASRVSASSRWCDRIRSSRTRSPISRGTSEDAASDLQASCPTQIPQTPVALLDAVATRLKALADAMKSVRPKLENFYASLSDEQKASFNIMGSPQPSHQSSGR